MCENSRKGLYEEPEITSLMLIGIGGGSLAKELNDWFCYTDTPTVSAFIQQRDEIKPEVLEMVFREFVSTTVPQDLWLSPSCSGFDKKNLRILPMNFLLLQTIKTKNGKTFPLKRYSF